jgi:hypothetical protein
VVATPTRVWTTPATLNPCLLTEVACLAAGSTPGGANEQRTVIARTAKETIYTHLQFTPTSTQAQARLLRSLIWGR